MHTIIYSSHLADTMSGDIDNLLSDISENAKVRNKSKNITGVLIFQNNYFLQALEGEESQLSELYEVISNDSRHADIVCHADQPIAERSFGDWTMEIFKIDSIELFNSETISILKSLYDRTFEPSAKDIIEFLKKMIDEIDTLKIQSLEAKKAY